MPTVPPTFRSDSVVFPGVPNQIVVPDGSHGPTPDPELDDVSLVAVVTGDTMGAVTSTTFDSAPAHVNTTRKPRLSLTGLTLHSPSSIIGTPFDVSEPRFEYPFPVTVPEPELYLGPAFPAFSGHISSYAPSPPPATTHVSKYESVKAFSPKLQSRDPPVPPSLAKKRRSIHAAAVPPPPPSTNATRGRSGSVRVQKGRGSTSIATSEERKPALARKSTASSGKPNVKPMSSADDQPIVMISCPQSGPSSQFSASPSASQESLPISLSVPATINIEDTHTP